jgi:hypothetical protein
MMGLRTIFHKSFCWLMGRTFKVKYKWQGCPYIEDIYSGGRLHIVIGNTNLQRQLWKCSICGHGEKYHNEKKRCPDYTGPSVKCPALKLKIRPKTDCEKCEAKTNCEAWGITGKVAA